MKKSVVATCLTGSNISSFSLIDQSMTVIIVHAWLFAIVQMPASTSQSRVPDESIRSGWFDLAWFGGQFVFHGVAVTLSLSYISSSVRERGPRLRTSVLWLCFLLMQYFVDDNVLSIIRLVRKQQMLFNGFETKKKQRERICSLFSLLYCIILSEMCH